MIISVSGMGYTGSGTVKDFLKQYDSIQADDKLEFNLLYTTDGIGDLETHLFDYHVRFMSADAAIKRFVNLIKRLDSPRGEYRLATSGQFRKLSMDYVDSITQVKWKGHWDYDRLYVNQLERTLRYRVLDKIYPYLEKMVGRELHFLIDKQMYYSCNPENFYESTKKYLNSILTAIGYNLEKPLVLDQAVPFDDPTRYMKYLDTPKVIIVDKDPRDLYLLLKKTIKSKGSWFPHENVEDFVIYYETMRKNSNQAHPDILVIHFEDLIYEYNLTTSKIINFLGIGTPDRPYTIFHPEKSINNTQLFNRYPDMSEEVRYIEIKLKNYLYPFEKYTKLRDFGESF